MTASKVRVRPGIVQVVNVRWHNATAWYALTLARLLRDAGYRVLVLALPDTEPCRRAMDLGLDVAALDLNTRNPARLARLGWRLRRLLAAFRPRVVNCHRGEAFVLFALLKAAGSYRLVRTRGDARAPRNNLANRLLHARAADAVIATNSAMARRLAALGVPESRLFTILGGVDTGRFAFDPAGRRRVRLEWRLQDDELAVGLLGRFDPVKGHAVLARAVARLRGQGLGLRPVFLGRTANLDADHMRRLLHSHGLADGIVHCGELPDLAARLSALDLAAAPSTGSEAIARAVLELMACNRPVVASRVGVMPDLLEPEALAEPGNDADLARALTAALGHGRDLLAAQAAALEALGLEAFLEKTLRAYGL